jgi:hypothetical protein
MKGSEMQLTLSGYEVRLSVQRRRVKTRPQNKKPAGQPPAPCAGVEHQYLSACGCRYLAPTR